MSGAGAAYLFGRNASESFRFDPVGTNLTAPSPMLGDAFGSAVAMDLSYAVVGAPNANSAYVFEVVDAVTGALQFNDSISVRKRGCVCVCFASRSCEKGFLSAVCVYSLLVVFALELGSGRSLIWVAFATPLGHVTHTPSPAHAFEWLCDAGFRH